MTAYRVSPPRVMNWGCNSSLADWLLLQCASLLLSLLIFVPHLHAQTQAEMNAQARADFARADADLNKTYQSVLARLRDPASEQNLRETQRGWIMSRDAEAARAAKEAEGGSMAPTLRYEKMTELTQERIKELKAMLDHGAESGPKPAASSVTAAPASGMGQSPPEAPPSASASASEVENENENADRTQSCDCPSSPNGKFTFLASDTGENSSGDQLQILDLIEKKSGKKLQRIDDVAIPVLWSAVWAPDSNGFALKTKVVGHPRLQGVNVYFRSGETFQKIELPNLPDAIIEEEVVWAPDSKRFGLNYMIDNRKINYQTVAFYQLRGDKWVALRSPVDETSQLAQLVQLANKQLPKNANERRIWRSRPEENTLKVREWTDANTAIVYAYSDWDELKAGFLFTLKFDKSGNWKIIKTHQMSKEELEEEQ